MRLSCFLTAVLCAPIQLVRPSNDRNSLLVTSEGEEFLNGLRGPISVISAVGSIHSGKSFLINQLAKEMINPEALNISDAETGEAFGVGHSIDAATIGIWTLSKPIIYKGTNILFLDTEGLFSHNSATVYDAKLFAISTLMSSEIIYNTVKFIDNQQIESLERLIRRTNLFGLRSYASRAFRPDENKIDDVISFLQALIPNRLSWVVQNFVQELEHVSAHDWLAELLKIRSSASGASSEEADVTLETSRFFKEIDCVPLSTPVVDTTMLPRLDQVPPSSISPTYIGELNEFRRRLFERAAKGPKVKNSAVVNKKVAMNGGDVSRLLSFLVQAANNSEIEGNDVKLFSSSPTIADQFSELQMRIMRSDILIIMTKDLNGLIKDSTARGSILLRSKLDASINKAAQKSKELWATTSRGILVKELGGESDREYMNKFEAELRSEIKKVEEHYCEVMHNWCREHAVKLENDFRSRLPTVDKLPLVPEVVIHSVNMEIPRIVSEFQQPFANEPIPACCAITSKQFELMIRKAGDTFRHENNSRIRKACEEVNKIVVENHERILRENKAYFTRKTYQEVVSELSALYDNSKADAYRKNSNFANTEIFKGSIPVLRQTLESLNTAALNEWESDCVKRAKDYIEQVQTVRKSEIVHQISMPVEDDIVDNVFKEHASEARKEFKAKFSCFDSPKGLILQDALEQKLRDIREWLREKNVSSVTAIHSHVFDMIRAELNNEANLFWFVSRFREHAKTKAFRALIHDRKLVSGVSAVIESDSNQRLLLRSAQHFSTTLIDAEREINGNFFVRVVCLSILIYGAFSIYYAIFGGSAPVHGFLGVGFSIPALLLLYSQDYRKHILTLLFTKLWMSNWTTLGTGALGIVIGLTVPALTSYRLCGPTVHRENPDPCSHLDYGRVSQRNSFG